MTKVGWKKIVTDKKLRIGAWTMLAVFTLAVIKFFLHQAGLEFLSVNALFTSAIAGVVFIIGFLLSKFQTEAQKWVSDLTASAKIKYYVNY